MEKFVKKSVEIIFLSLLRCLVLTYNVTMNAHQTSIYIRTTECVLLFLIDSRLVVIHKRSKLRK